MSIHIIKSIGALKNMVNEMYKKDIELKRITKTATLLMKTGVSSNSIPQDIITKCLREQYEDGGWVSIVDTMWNITFLNELDSKKYNRHIKNGKKFLLNNLNKEGLWGRSKRDISRIPVTGIMLYLIPEFATKDRLLSLENLWRSEKNSLTYKSAYTLMAFSKNKYNPNDTNIIRETINWLIKNQRKDGSFAPWFDHPVNSDVYCTSIALLGLISYKDMVNKEIIKKSYKWIVNKQLKSGIWAYHEIEDGTSWALYAMKRYKTEVELK